MSTKIKGHRIADGSIKQKHLEPTIKIPESQLGLDYKTHSNAGDLTVEQKNTMTLGGNADGLHYHTGGGGGPQGIYTNEQRDAQILKLSMMVNADVFGLDNAIIDNLNDDSSIYRGYPVALSPALLSLTDDPSFPGSLQQTKEYSYGVSYKNRHGQTNVVKVASAITGAGFTNAMRIQLDDVPIDNKGVSIYRTEGSTELLLIDEMQDSWENPHGIHSELYTSDKTTGISSVAFSYDKSENTPKPYMTEDMQAVADISVPLGETPSVDVPFDYYLISSSRTSAYGLEILWDKIPSYAPRDYEIYYTTDTQVTDFEHANWQKFSKLTPHGIAFKTPACFGTNGSVEDNYRVINNTLPENKFHINPVEGITYIRIKVTRIDNLCRLKKVNLVDAERSQNRCFFLDTQGIDFTPFNTIKFDYKTTGYHIPFQVEAARKDEAVGGVTSLYDLIPGSHFTSAHPEIRDGYMVSRLYYSRIIAGANFNRVRIGVRILANSDFLAENFYLRFSNSGSWNIPGSGNVPFYNIPITFSGKHYLKCNNPSHTEIWSDWVYLPKGAYNIQHAELVCKSIRGQFMYSTHNGYTAYKTDDSFIGKEDNNGEWFADNNGNRCMFVVQFGTTNSVSKNLTNGFTHSKWHKGYMDIGSVNAIEYLKFFTGSPDTKTGTIVLDNFTITKNKNVLGPTVSSTNTISSGGSVSDVTSDEFGLSKYKRVYFNQYATVDNPQIVSFEFVSPQTINQINFTCLTEAKTPTNYVLQFATDVDASADDPLNSMRWMNFTGVTIGESSFDIGFQGTIKGSRVIANNVCNTVLSHRFDAADIVKVRIWIEGTIGGSLPLIDNLEIYSAIDSDELKLIFDTSSPITSPRFIMVDDGIREKDVKPPRYNTTGSYNILWNKDKNMIEVIDKDNDATLYTNLIPLSLFQDFMLSAQHIGNVLFEASFDDGDTFVPVSLDVVHSLPAQSDSIIIKAILKDKATLHAFAMLYSL